jgi:transposase
MARYSSAFKSKAVARLLPPESAPLDIVSREIGVRVGTPSRWRAEALSDSHDRLWTDRGHTTTGLEAVSVSKVPRFMIVAAKDLDGPNLDRVQVVKG